MKILKNKTKIATIFIMTLLMASALLVIAEKPVKAQLADQQPSVSIPSGKTANNTVETLSRLSFRPRVVGIGQPVLVNFWLQATYLSANWKFLQSYKITITKPDGTQDVYIKDSYPADTTGWFEFVPDQVGQWTIKLDFLGQYFPTGRYYNGYIVTNSSGSSVTQSYYYQPSSDGPYGLTVQEDPVLSWPITSTPTDYWTRPVTTHNRDWWSILGSWPSTGVVGGGPDWPADTNTYAQTRYGYTPYVQGPKSSHVVWKRPFNVGGMIGGSMGTQTVWESARVIYGHPSMIYAGRAYWTTTKVINGAATSVWECYDLRTGEIYWDRYPVSPVPTFVINDPGIAEIAEAVPHLATVYLGAISNGYLVKYDPYTGAIVGNYSLDPITSGTFFADPYVYSVQNLGSSNYRLIKWSVAGTSQTFSTRVVSNITWLSSNLPATVDYEAGLAVSTSATRIVSYSLTTGEVVANITTGMVYATEGTPAQVDHGKLAQRYNDGNWHCWDMRTGSKLWVSELSSYPWGTFGTYGSVSYGGMIMSNQFDSVTAINWTNGKIVWSYISPAASPYETPYTFENQTVNPWHTCGQVADGVYYTTNSEHSGDMPIKRGWYMHAINVTTGEMVWKLPMAQSGSTDGSRVFQGAIADGYLAYSNAYDTTMYVVGKGKSQTTITAPDVSVPAGTGIEIKGSVLDLSPAQPGTACVSKESMTVQMEQLHWQLPITGIYGNETIIGVPVSIDAVDPNGNFIHIETVTSEGYSGTFGYAWHPTIPGQYTITATFAGDDSYGSSFATTYVNIGEAAATASPTPASNIQATTQPYELYIIGMGLAIIIVVIAIGLLLLRKRA